MRKFTLNIFTLSLGLSVMPMVEAAPTAQQQLLEQVRLGEATHREDLVQQSLYRLELIDPNNPDVVAPVSVLCYVRAILMARKNSSIGCRS
ncbi:cellulose synthase [Shigella sp. FC2383]|uniref:cellulose synthase n=1 Tax=Shigella sp. FC2383 TaxID=1890305 RepID=UPI000AA1F7A7